MKPILNMSNTIALCLLVCLATAVYCDQGRTLRDLRQTGRRRGYTAYADSFSSAAQDPRGARSRSSASSSSTGYEQPIYQYQHVAPAPAPAPVTAARPLRTRSKPATRYTAKARPGYYSAVAPGRAQAFAYADAEQPAYYQVPANVPDDDYYDEDEDDAYAAEQEELRRQQALRRQDELVRRRPKARQSPKQPPAPKDAHPRVAQASAAASARVNGPQASASAKASARAAGARRARVATEEAEKAKLAEAAAAAAAVAAEKDAQAYAEGFVEENDDEDEDEEDDGEPEYEPEASDEAGVYDARSYKSRVAREENHEEDHEDGDSFLHSDQYGKDEDEDAAMDYRNKEKNVYKKGDEFRKNKKDVKFVSNYSKKSRENKGSLTASDKWSNSRVRNSKKTKKDIDQSSTKFADGKVETERAQASGHVEESEEQKKGSPRTSFTRQSYVPFFRKPVEPIN